ncbi:MAG: hypothetical protein FJW96_01335 [Actinobacteria bacterium]|nr:hypothetical protein [Actinomycetota bacterium]
MKITVLRPDLPAPPPEALELAPRGALPEHPVIGLVSNGKPHAAELLEALAAELRARVGDGDVVMVRKPSAAYPITVEQATDMAARAHLVITGVGD